MRDTVLTEAEIASGLEELAGTGWALEGDLLVRTTKCQGFAGALAYVNAVGALAEAADHHPDIDIRWNTVTLALTTHDSGGITRRDIELAKQIAVVREGIPAEG
ncbi:MAG: 4a-hydroxytetrahydrobiopterin dehydratase [Acidimicrobiaceae bacterium]|jgi:4a-hydroxytetrahydrobiopterin dehydratase|nr:4a-hydroxytetrahydrobiopterin dehydratase [Acidimicrobiaceae bacterium]